MKSQDIQLASFNPTRKLLASSHSTEPLTTVPQVYVPSLGVRSALEPQEIQAFEKK